ncbi:MAG: DHH family phosphoesterase [FCB group bacterium]|nr:DHH family phosphoesterase [FCB group bacterium]
MEYDLEWSITSLGAILRVCGREGRILALMQDNPDPDSIASAMAFATLIHRKLGKRVSIGYGGTVGRAENAAMLELLHVEAEHVTPRDLSEYAILCLVDTQPYSGNNVCVKSRTIQVVIDHHTVANQKSWKAEVADVRPHYGATATILYEYLLAARIEIDADLATALFYGILSDTQELGRQASHADVAAFQTLFQLADRTKLARIRRAPVPADYFKMLHAALEDTVVAGETVIAHIATECFPEMMAEVADLLLRLRGAKVSVCYGRCGNTIHLSVRTLDGRTHIANRVRLVVEDIGLGGGHRLMAGAQIPVGDDPEATTELVRQRILRVFAPRGKPKPLFEH